jgi:3-methylcrotonyl-CoA carboxylase alpha subunit
MPGKVAAVLVEPGALVERGQPLLVLEAMKMEHTIRAPEAGRIVAVRYAAGKQVEDGALLVELAAEKPPP